MVRVLGLDSMTPIEKLKTDTEGDSMMCCRRSIFLGGHYVLGQIGFESICQRFCLQLEHPGTVRPIGFLNTDGHTHRPTWSPFLVGVGRVMSHVWFRVGGVKGRIGRLDVARFTHPAQ